MPAADDAVHRNHDQGASELYVQEHPWPVGEGGKQGPTVFEQSFSSAVLS